MENKNTWLAVAFVALVVGFVVGRTSSADQFLKGQEDACTAVINAIGAAPGTHCVVENGEILVVNEFMKRKWKLDGTEVN